MDEQKIAERVAVEQIVKDDSTPNETALQNIDQALTIMVAALTTIEENLPLVETESVPQKAALDNMKETLDEALKPYLASFAEDFTFFG